MPMRFIYIHLFYTSSRYFHLKLIIICTIRFDFILQSYGWLFKLNYFVFKNLSGMWAVWGFWKSKRGVEEDKFGKHCYLRTIYAKFMMRCEFVVHSNFKIYTLLQYVQSVTKYNLWNKYYYLLEIKKMMLMTKIKNTVTIFLFVWK